MDCKEFLKQIEAWEVSGTSDKENLHNLEAHAAECTKCSRQYAHLFPFVFHDAGVNHSSLEESQPLFNSVIERVMAKIPATSHHAKKMNWLPMTAAAAFIIVVGILQIFPMLGNIFKTDEILIQFELKAAEASSVYLVGDFTDWDPYKIPLEDTDHDGVWRVKILLRKNHSYTYNFIIDNELWIPDPEAEFVVDDGFGGSNSMINL